MKKFLKYCFNTSSWQPNRVEWLQLLSSIPKEERDKVTRFAFKSNAKQTLIGRVLIRHCLHKLLSIEWSALSLGQTPKGRPYLKTKETLCQAGLNTLPFYVDFNVSHSGDYTIIFAGVQTVTVPGGGSGSKRADLDTSDDYFRLGADVMKIEVDERTRVSHRQESEEAVFQQELNRLERVISSKFSNTEQNFIYSKISPVEKLSAFYRLWSLKESYVKAVGDGVGFDLRRIEAQPQSELFIDLMSRRHLVAMDTVLSVDSKVLRNCKFYEQYFTNNLLNAAGSSSGGAKTQLHIITTCIVDKEKGGQGTQAQASMEARTECNEFVEISLEEILTSIISCTSLDTIDESNSQEYEEHWVKFKQKSESAVMP